MIRKANKKMKGKGKKKSTQLKFFKAGNDPAPQCMADHLLPSGPICLLYLRVLTEFYGTCSSLPM